MGHIYSKKIMFFQFEIQIDLGRVFLFAKSHNSNSE